MRLLSPSCVLFTEMVTADEVLASPEDALFQTQLELESAGPSILQLGGRDPELLATAVKLASSHHTFPFTRFNLNVGCPSDTVATKNSFGCSLMLEPELTADCCAAMRAAERGRVEVSVKCRTGVDDNDSMEDLLSFLTTVSERGGVNYFQIHARKAIRGLTPTKNRLVPPLMHGRVQEVARALPHLRIELNGGVDSVDSALGHLRDCPELSGVMVGRAVINHPYSFARMDAALAGITPTPVTPSRGEILDSYEALLAREIRARPALAPKGAPSSVSRLLAPVYNLFAGEVGSLRYQRKMTALIKRGISSPFLILATALRELEPGVLDSKSFRNSNDIAVQSPWMGIAKQSHAPLRKNIV
jgi:tRNA-dihydrouridine synthase A